MKKEIRQVVRNVFNQRDHLTLEELNEALPRTVSKSRGSKVAENYLTQRRLQNKNALKEFMDEMSDNRKQAKADILAE